MPPSLYRHGYPVQVSGGHVVRHGRTLVVAQDGQPQRVKVVVTRR